MRRAVVVLVLFLLLTPLHARAAAGAAARAPQVRPQVPDAGALRAPDLAFERAIASGRAPDAHALGALSYALVGERASASAVAAAAVGSFVAGSTELALPWADADGDGRVDLLGVSRGFSSPQLALAGIRGTDGATLWSLDLGAPDSAVVTPTLDITSDGRADVLVTTLTILSQRGQGACLAVCAGEVSATYRWDVLVVSGADGSVAWSRSFPGCIVEVVTGVASWRASNFSVVAFPSTRGVVVDAYDDTTLGGFPVVASRGAFYDGASGALRAERSLDLGADFGILLPASHASSAVEWERDATIFAPGVGQTAVDVEGFDGASDAHAWWSNRSVAATTVTAPALADVTGDGTDDIFIVALASNGDATRLVSGATGAQPWPAAVPGIPYVLSSTLALTVELSTVVANTHFVAHRVVGASGAVVLTTQPFLGDQSDAHTGLFVWGDVDGDGVADLVLNHLYNVHGYASTSLVESGATGAALARQDAPGIWFLTAAGDRDAAGRGALDRVTTEYHYDLTSGRLVAFDVRIEGWHLDGSASWWRNETFPDVPGIDFGPVGDASGGPGEDAVLNVADESASGVVGSRTVLMDAASGAVDWTRGALPS